MRNKLFSLLPTSGGLHLQPFTSGGRHLQPFQECFQHTQTHTHTTHTHHTHTPHTHTHVAVYWRFGWWWHTYTPIHPHAWLLAQTHFFTSTGAFLSHACGDIWNLRTYFTSVQRVFLVEMVVLQAVLWDICAWSARFLVWSSRFLVSLGRHCDISLHFHHAVLLEPVICECAIELHSLQTTCLIKLCLFSLYFSSKNI